MTLASFRISENFEPETSNERGAVISGAAFRPWFAMRGATFTAKKLAGPELFAK
jgi:hypothetical protein